MRQQVIRSGGATVPPAKLLVLAVTVTAIGAAILACGLLVSGQQGPAFLLLAAAMALDMVDGPLARWAGVQSKLGAWLDSCGDVFVYLLFPAIYWAAAYGMPGLVLAVFLGAGLFRLVRFSLRGFVETQGHVYYAGMPVFYAQFLLILTYTFQFPLLLLGALLLGGSGLMVSLLPFRKIHVRGLAGGLVLYLVIVLGRMFHVF